jgi:hypothetical protein
VTEIRATDDGLEIRVEIMGQMMTAEQVEQSLRLHAASIAFHRDEADRLRRYLLAWQLVAAAGFVLLLWSNLAPLWK